LKPIKVLIASPAYDPAHVYGGPIRSIHGLCKGLVNLGIRIDVLTTVANGGMELDVPVNTFVDRDGVKVMYYPVELLDPFIFSFGQWKAIRDLVGNYDLVHIQSVFTFNTLWAARYARRERIPYLISPRGSLVRGLLERRGGFRKKTWLRMFDGTNLKQAAAVHLTTEYERTAMHELGLFPFREEVIPNGIEIPSASEEPASVGLNLRRNRGIREGERLILFLGRINWEKGLDRLIPAFAKVSGQYPETKLMLAGYDTQGYLPHLMELAANAGVSRSVVATGHLDGEEKWQWIKESEIVVLPSYSESFGLAALEGAAMGKPVVVTWGVGIAAEIEKAGAGLVTEHSVEAIAWALANILASRYESARMGENGRKLVREKFLWPSVAGKMLSLYEDLLRQRAV
jgi:glycosyltransferase involved in cell wall biosynthesis